MAGICGSIMRKILLFLLTIFMAGMTLAQEWAKARLEKSPRHGEWITVRHGQRDVKCFVTYPEVPGKATAVVVIHEIFGLSDWVRGMTDQLAEAGYIAIAPDLLSGSAPNGGGTAELGSGDNVRKAIASLSPDQVTADLNAVAAHVSRLPACNGKVAAAGFCWGGAQAFRLATNNKDIKSALVFYGTGPDKADDVARIGAPVHGFYAENDARVNATLPVTGDLMTKAGKSFAPVTYPGGGHGFMRAGEDPAGSEGNKKAREAAWKRVREILGKL
jgi:carboxymethylenebutenolidase